MLTSRLRRQSRNALVSGEFATNSCVADGPRSGGALLYTNQPPNHLFITYRHYLSPYCVSGCKLSNKELSGSGLCDHLEGWDREGGRETQEGGDMGIYVYI